MPQCWLCAFTYFCSMSALPTPEKKLLALRKRLYDEGLDVYFDGLWQVEVRVERSKRLGSESQRREVLCLVLNMLPLCPGIESFYGSSTDLPSPSHLWTNQKLAGCCQSSQKAPFKRCFRCECQSCTNFSNNKARQCKARISICGLWLCKSLFQGTSIHPVRIVYHVFKLSDLQYGHHAMSPCVSFLICVHRNWVVVNV